MTPLQPDGAELRALQGRLRLAALFAWQAVRASRRRAMLAMLGVGVGIASVVSMLMIGASVRAQSLALLDSLGGDLIAIESQDEMMAEINEPSRSRAPAGPRGAQLMDAISGMLRSMPETGTATSVSLGTSCDSPRRPNAPQIPMVGASHLLQAAAGLKVASGRFLTPSEGSTMNAVLGAKAATELRKSQPGLRVGSQIQLCGRTMTVVGILHYHPGIELLPSMQINSAVMVNAPALRTTSSDSQRMTMLIHPRAGVSAPAFAQQLEMRIAAAGIPSLKVESAGRMSAMRSEQANLYSTFMAILGGVALLVGSLGITNLMIVAVTERRPEIGLRKAIGAKVTDIAAQFVAEALIICFAGSLAGALFGMLCTGAVLLLAGLPVSAGWHTPLVVIGMACFSGLAAGAYPAVQAARLDPVQTLSG